MLLSSGAAENARGKTCEKNRGTGAVALATLAGPLVGPTRNATATAHLFQCSQTDRERLASRRLWHSKKILDGLLNHLDRQAPLFGEFYISY